MTAATTTLRPLIVSEKITLQSLKASDAAALYPVIESNRELLEKYLYWAKSVTDIGSTQTYINERIHSAKPHAQWFKIVLAGNIVGVLGVKEIINKQAEVGYWLSQTAQGQGVITRAVSKVCEHLHNELQVQSVKICCLANNHASIAVANRLGAKHIDTLSDYHRIDNALQDLLIFQLTI